MARLPSLKTRPFGYKPTVPEIEPKKKSFDLGLSERKIMPFGVSPQVARTTEPIIGELPRYEVRLPFAKEKTITTPGTIYDLLIAVGARVPEIPPRIMIGAVNFFRKNINTLIAGKPVETKQFETALGFDVKRFGIDPNEMMTDTIESGLKQFEIEKQTHPGRSDYLNAGMATAKTIVPDIMDVLIATNIARGVLKLAAGAVRTSAKQLPDSVLFKIQQQQVNPNAIFDALRGSNLASAKDVKVASNFIKNLTVKERISLYYLARSYETTGLQVPLPTKFVPTILGKIAGKPAPGVQMPPRISGLLPGAVRPVAQAGFISPEAVGKDIVNLAKQAKNITAFKGALSKEQLAIIVARGFTSESFFSAVKKPITPAPPTAPPVPEAIKIAPEAIPEALKAEKGIIPQELQPLAQEAKKYKSAEEFVASQKEKFGLPARKVVSDLKIGDVVNIDRPTNNVPQVYFGKITKIEKDGITFLENGKTIKIPYQDEGIKTGFRVYDPEIIKISEAAKKEGYKDLTDFYTQAVKEVKEIKPAELKQANELIRAIHATVKEKGLTQKAFSDIKMKYGEARHLVGLRERMTTEQLKAVLKAVQRVRPKRIGFRRVITRKTENNIQELYETLIKEKAMTPNHYEQILRKENVIDWKTGQVKEPRYIDAKNFITQSKGKDIINRMIDEAYVIKTTEGFNRAIEANPEISKMVGNIDKRISFERGRPMKDPISLESMRYYLQKAELKTEAPVFAVYQDLIDSHLENVSGRTIATKKLEESTPLFKKIASDNEALQRVSNYIASKSRLIGKPEMPADITPEEIKLAKEIENILKGYETKVRIAKFLNYYYYNKPIADYDRYSTEIKKAIDIYESKGVNALKKYLETQEWGVIKSGYEPLQVAFPKMRLYKIGPAGVGKGHIQIRLDPTYHPQDRNILQRLSSYMKQMDTLSEMQPKIKALVRLFDDNWDKFDNPQRIKAEMEQFFQELKGYGMGGGFFERMLARMYSQAMRTIILPSPALTGRNLLQNVAFAPDKSILIDPRNKKLTAKDIEYIETYVLQTKPMMEDWFMTKEKPLPGLGFLTKLVDKVKIYPYSDVVNRYWAFWAKINQVNRGLGEKTTEEMMKKAAFEDMTLLEQRMALGILARDGKEAMARYVARAYTDKIHFLYERAQRSPAEMGKMGRLIGNLMLFPRAYWELLTKNFFKMMGKKIPLATRLRALKVLFMVIAGGMATGSVYQKVTGRTKNPYNPLELLAYEPGGLMLGTITQSGEVYSNIVMAVSGDKRALARLTTEIPTLADMWIPFYSYVLRGFEASTDMKNVDRYALRKLRELIDEEYKVRGGDYELEREALEKWQYFIAGAGIDAQIKERLQEEKAQTFPSGTFETRPGVDQRRQGLPSLKTR